MKRTIIALVILTSFSSKAQFSVNVEAPEDYSAKEAIIYTLNGTKDIIASKEIKKNNSWYFKFTKPYTGMLKIYFPENNNSINLITENKDVKLKLITNKNKVEDIVYLDSSNKIMNDTQSKQQKRETILPALYQIKEYYKNGTDFGVALEKEIKRLSVSDDFNPTENPFVNYYTQNYTKFIEKNAEKKAATQEEILSFLTNSSDMLESSSLVNPILVAYLNIGPSANADASVQKLLTALNVETPRGQMILSELIDIFDSYSMDTLKNKYLTEAKNLKCTITERLANTIKANKNVEMGATFPNYNFTSVVNTKAKSLHDIKASKKIIIFWASTCSHCEAELPKLLEKYNQLKAQNVEVVGFSVDTEKESYEKRIAVFPWINTTELKGWNSTFIKTYNFHSTPTYFILDENNKIIDKPDHVDDVLTYFKLK